jgi:uncharacterized Zn-finger protein
MPWVEAKNQISYNRIVKRTQEYEVKNSCTTPGGDCHASPPANIERRAVSVNPKQQRRLSKMEEKTETKPKLQTQ